MIDYDKLTDAERSALAFMAEHVFYDEESMNDMDDDERAFVTEVFERLNK